jgi:hypothetical protein
MNKTRTFAPLIAAVLLLVPVVYVGSYLALVIPPGRTILGPPTPVPGGSIFVKTHTHQTILGFERYRWGGQAAERIFWPLEQLDRRVRPGAWTTWEPHRGGAGT